MNGFKKTDLYKNMKQAISHIAEKVNKPVELVEHVQETNIFKILRLENYEIRHGNFLEFLMDPERNVELANRFIANFIENIVDELNLVDSGLDRIISDKEFEVLRVTGENRFTEIPVANNDKKRIDHALEIKSGQTRRVLVFEYKLNGVLQNDLDSYQKSIEQRYDGTKARCHFFILELGTKKHNLSSKGAFNFIGKSTLVEAIQDTVSSARQKDMMATRLYLEQYLEILEPEVGEEFIFAGLESQLWNSWNPAMEAYEDANDIFDSLVEEYIEVESLQVALCGYYYSEVFDRRVKQKLDNYSSQLITKLNQGWLRILPQCQYKDFYFWTSLSENNGETFLTINFQSHQRPKASMEQAKKQKYFVLGVLNKSILVKPLNKIENLDRCKEIGVNQDFEVIQETLHKDDSKYPYEFKVRYMRKIDVNSLESICTLEESEDFDLMLEELTDFVELINSAN